MSDEVETIDRSLTDVGRPHRRLKVLFLPAWYPSRENPARALFIKEHARAASLYNEVVVLYVCADEAMLPWRRCETSEEVEDGIRTVRVRHGKYWPIGVSLKRLISGGQPRDSARDSSSTKGGGLLRTFKALLTIDGIVIGDMLYCMSTLVAFRKLLKSGWSPDVIHAHVFTAGVPAVILGKVYRTPVVITEHWTAFQTRELSLSGRAKAVTAMKRARGVLPVSNALKESLQAHGITSSLRVVPNVVNTELFCRPSIDRKKDGKKHPLLVAILGPRKGIPYLLEALNLVRRNRDDFLLDIVGDGPQRSEYEQLAARLGLQGNVMFHGRQPEVHSFMRRCDFFVMPSLYENFGVVYIEAMACGKPVIASDIPGPNEFINHDVGVLVPPRDVIALAGAIDFMLDHHADYCSEGIAQYARERFGYDAVGKMLDEVYREVTLSGIGGGGH